MGKKDTDKKNQQKKKEEKKKEERKKLNESHKGQAKKTAQVEAPVKPKSDLAVEVNQVPAIKVTEKPTLEAPPVEERLHAAEAEAIIPEESTPDGYQFEELNSNANDSCLPETPEPEVELRLVIEPDHEAPKIYTTTCDVADKRRLDSDATQNAAFSDTGTLDRSSPRVTFAFSDEDQDAYEMMSKSMISFGFGSSSDEEDAPKQGGYAVPGSLKELGKAPLGTPVIDGQAETHPIDEKTDLMTASEMDLDDRSEDMKLHDNDSGLSATPEPKLVFDLPPEQLERFKFLCDRPLKTTWTLWHYKKELGSKEWNQGLVRVCDINTVGEFWELKTKIRSPLYLTSGDDYYLFKSHIRPEWEDPMNINGGRWTIEFIKCKHFIAEIDEMWENTMMLLVGEQFGNDDVCGAVFQIRGKGHKIAIWTRDSKNDYVCHSIGQTLIERLGLVHNNGLIQSGTIGYVGREQLKNRGGSTVNQIYRLSIQ